MKNDVEVDSKIRNGSRAPVLILAGPLNERQNAHKQTTNRINNVGWIWPPSISQHFFYNLFIYFLSRSFSFSLSVSLYSFCVCHSRSTKMPDLEHSTKKREKKTLWGFERRENQSKIWLFLRLWGWRVTEWRKTWRLISCLAWNR